MFKSASLSRQTASPAFATGLSAALRVLFLAGSLSVTLAHADEYSDVNRLVRAGQLAEAMTKADQYLAAKPRDPQMRFLKGVIQSESGKPTDAISTFTQITQDYPELPEPYNNLAVLYAGQNQFDKARAALEMAIRTNPSYATAHENLGDVYAKLASQAYSKALQLDGGNAGVQPKLALIRTLFSPETRGQKPAVGAPPVAAVSAASAIKPPVVVAAKPPVPAAAPAVAPTPVPALTPAPAVAVVAVKPAGPATVASTAEKDVENAVHGWSNAWASKDMNGYLASYGKEFDPSGNQTRKAWEEERRSRILGKSRISVKLNNLSVSVSGNTATAKFKQDYSADSLNVSSRKTLNLAKTGDRWVIVKESTGT